MKFFTCNITSLVDYFNFFYLNTTIFSVFVVKSRLEKENRGEIMAIPKYQYIKDELKNKIISGQFASGFQKKYHLLILLYNKSKILNFV